LTLIEKQISEQQRSSGKTKLTTHSSGARDPILSSFYEAEGYHQDYLAKRPDEPYIVINDLPKVENLRKQLPRLYKAKELEQLGKSWHSLALNLRLSDTRWPASAPSKSCTPLLHRTTKNG
jgi:Peptide methionine sulfoxide reductase